MSFHPWRTHRLRDELARDELTQLDSLKYMWGAAFLYVFANYSALWFGGYRDWTLPFEALLVLAISVVGTHESFLANGGPGGRDFILRFAAISVPVGFKILALNLIVCAVMFFGLPYVLTPTSFRDPVFVYRLIYFVTSLALTVIYYWRIAYHMRRIGDA